MEKRDVAKYIDHTILKAMAVEKDVINICSEAKEYGFASVCVNPCNVKLVSNELKGSNVKTCSVIGFPLGTNTTELKAAEAKKAVEDGAHEIDMVINVGKLKDGDIDYVVNDISQVVKASAPSIVKVIIEACYLTEEEKVKACRASEKAGARFVKTSTGFGPSGATVEDVKLMKKTVGDRLEVKAAGGIKTTQDAYDFINAGANRLGASSGVAIVSGDKNESSSSGY